MPAWTDFLVKRGARFAGDRVIGFDADPPEANANVVVPLTQLAATRFSGADAIGFLQGQLSCDVKGRDPDSATPGSYCTPKGRMLATFLALRERDAVRLLASRDVTPALAKRLKMFVLRSKVTVADETDTLALMGVAGANAGAAVSAALGAAPPEQVWRFVRGPADLVALRVPGERFLLLAPSADAARAWDATVAAGQAPAPTATWERLDIVEGLPWVTAATQEQFIPQMTNLELIGGVSFDKGCYPGQEVVARTHYRGEVKRRLRLAHVDAEAPPAPGDELFVGGTAEQTCGMVVNAAAAPGGGFDLLAVVQNAALGKECVRLRAGDGPKLAFRELPYPVPAPS